LVFHALRFTSSHSLFGPAIDNTTMKQINTCVRPKGTFQYGLHKPSYSVTNLRQHTRLTCLGQTRNGTQMFNAHNFPEDHIEVGQSDWIFEIPNPFPFKGRTFIDKEWADASASDPDKIRIPEPDNVSLTTTLKKEGIDKSLFAKLPSPLQLALATCSTDPEDLKVLAELSCEIVSRNGKPAGLLYDGQRPVIHNHPLFEAVANNPHLPDHYKIAMVIMPGAQGQSEIVGEWPKEKGSHVYEYLRRNSYIPGGHYAANMAEDAVRYSINSLSKKDITGLRHLYYQRSYIRLADKLGLEIPAEKRVLTEKELESLRNTICKKGEAENISCATIWGWNFGFDYAPSKYRLHASHQQIHQQYALIAKSVESYSYGTTDPIGHIPTYSCGDMVADLIEEYHQIHDHDFFADYRNAIFTNKRMDDRKDLDADLIVWRDNRVMLFVPKAQTSQWELQIMTLPDQDGNLPGNIFECDSRVRHSVDTAILKAQKALANLGATMVTTIEYSKRFGKQTINQPLIYALLPRLPESPGAFSEAQLRFINGHYPEDFAAVCRKNLA